MFGRRPQADPATPPATLGDDALSALCSQLALGDISALDGLYRDLARELYAFALWSCGRPDQAEDLVQETFVRLTRSADRVAKARRPKAYIFKLLHRLVIDAARRSPNETPMDELLLIPVGAEQEQLTHARQVTAFVSALPVAQRQALLLREIMGMSFREIADATGVTLFTAASRHRLGLKTLRRRLAEPPPTRDTGVES